jgi:hypothetical protein
VWCGSAKCRHRNCADDARKSGVRQGRFNSQLEDGNETVEVDMDEAGFLAGSGEADGLLEAKSLYPANQKVRNLKPMKKFKIFEKN